ncbi:MAG: hypothetical protein ACTHLN_04580 [Tepidisphaeraceae bacterium]
MTRLRANLAVWGVLAAVGWAGVAAAADRPGATEFSNAAKLRARNYVRPGWFLVDGRWARPQGTFAVEDFVSLVNEKGQDRLLTLNQPRFEPLLRDWRTSLVQLAGNPYGWKLSCPRRVWNDTHSSGTQNLLLVAGVDALPETATPVLTKIEVTPAQQVIQAIRQLDGAAQSIIIVFGENFVEATAGRFNAAPQFLIRSTSLQQLLIDRPTEMRTCVIPVLRLVNKGDNPLAPVAGDVYRAFADLPAEADMTRAIKALAPRLAARDPQERSRASAQLQSLGRRGVEAAMRMDRTRFAPEAANRLEAYIRDNTRDARPPEALRKDAGFLLDCLSDPDPAVRAAAGACVGK